jgi:hypothetical protein
LGHGGIQLHEGIREEGVWKSVVLLILAFLQLMFAFICVPCWIKVVCIIYMFDIPNFWNK